MKFVNKLSVLSLVVLMFSFMNIANAIDRCKGSPYTCDDVNKTNQTDAKKAVACNNAYEGVYDITSEDVGKSTQCKWTKSIQVRNGQIVGTKYVCTASGGSCQIY